MEVPHQAGGVAFLTMRHFHECTLAIHLAVQEKKCAKLSAIVRNATGEDIGDTSERARQHAASVEMEEMKSDQGRVIGISMDDIPGTTSFSENSL